MKTITHYNIAKNLPLLTLLQGTILMMVIVFSAQADDTEIFYTESEVNSNVLFVMDNSGSMKEKVAGTTADNAEVTVSYPIIHADDDAEERADGNDKYRITKTTSYDLGLSRDRVNDGNTTPKIKQRVGLRFQDIKVPKDAKITYAAIQFTSDRDASDADASEAELDIQIQNHGNPPKFRHEIKKNIKNRSLYGQKVEWQGDDLPAWNTINEQGSAQRTPNLKSLVQLVVDRGDWSEGNSMVFVITGDGYRSANSYNGEKDKAPILKIKYEATGEKTRMQVMQSALKIVLTEAPSNLSVGIMNYGDTTDGRRDYPNGIRFPAKPISSLARPIVEEAMKVDGVVRWDLSNIPEPNDTVTVGAFLSEIADSWEPRGMTPIVDAIYEAARYYRGDTLYWGNNKASVSYGSHPTSYARPDPSKVEPILNVYDVGSCDAAPIITKEWKNRWNDGKDNIAKWDNGKSGYKCPADRFNPSGPGSAANCTLTKHNCGERKQSTSCKNWIKATYKKVCDGSIDEDTGKRKCRNVKTKDAYCKNNAYYPPFTEKWCEFAYCMDSRKPIPEYISPAIADCQSNNIILMSDGRPEYTWGTSKIGKSVEWGKVRNMIGSSSCVDSPFGFKSGKCGKELTHYLAENDINSGLKGDQLVNTHVIGFSSGISESAEGYLKSLVTVEDDPNTPDKEGYFSAQNEEELAEAFAKTLDEIAQETRSQASPGYSVNVKSGLEHEDDIYIPVFDKSSGSRWSGNLKKFKLVDENNKRYIRGKITKTGDKDATGYIDAMTPLGLFRDDAWDEWSQSGIPDGNNVGKGGVAGLLTDPRKRNLYSNLVSYDLSKPQNQLKASNNKIENTMLFNRDKLGLSETEANKYRKKLINFIRGWVGGNDGGLGDGVGNGFPEGNIASHSRKHMGDMLHSEPVVITYKSADATGNGKKQYIFAGTNEGYLHAFDAITGKEEFAFMPKELLGNIEGQFTNKGEHQYGVDGNISYFIQNDNHNGMIDGSEKVFLYFGMRRGGNSYYALDVTDIDKPKLKWVVTGGTNDFKHLGESWSMPYIANAKVSGTKKPVVIFTGGNDEYFDYYGNTDDPISVTPDMLSTEKANGIYIVDADTGELLWDVFKKVSSAGAKLKHAIPGGARVLDVNRNGLLDRLYFADTGGFVWRLDLDEKLGSGSVLTKFASLGGDGDSSARKFYNEPDVGLLRGNGKTMFTVSVGSGMRPHPMNDEIEDHMFILLDKEPFKPMPTNYNKYITVGGDTNRGDTGLASVTIGGTGVNRSLTHSNGFNSGEKITETDKRGWYVIFGTDGEKVLAPSLTFEGSILFTTLIPESVTSAIAGVSVCAAPVTQGRFYAMNILTGEASMDLDESGGDPTDLDVLIPGTPGEIPGTPQTVFNKFCAGPGCRHDVDIRTGKKLTQTGTVDVGDVESIYWNAPEGKKIY